jgi:uncharacterized membrane protein YdbT with pleckstrin-like domain
MGYIEKNLMPGETVLYRARLHWVVFLWPVIWFTAAVIFFSHGSGYNAAAVAGYLLAVVAVAKAIESLIRFSTSEFGVTDYRVIAKVGFIRRSSIEIFMSKIEAIQINQDVLGRILGYGSILISGTGGIRDPLHDISNPLELKRRIQEQIAVAQKGR